MRIYDISLPLSPDLPIWPGDPELELERIATLEADGANVSRLSCSAHIGTHVDAPYHLIAGGKTVEGLALDVLIGPAHVVALPRLPMITEESLAGLDLPMDTRRMLFKTDNSGLWSGPGASEFRRDFVALAPAAAQWLVDRGIRLVGVDYLSVEPYTQQKPDRYPAHQILLGAGVVVIEGLNLAEVPPGVYELICLPLKLVGADGAPARVVLKADADER